MESTSFDTRQYEGEAGWYRVTLKYTVRGEPRETTYDVQSKEGRVTPYNLAVLKLEEALIDEGLGTRECGCCIDDDVDITDFKVKPIGN